ncbi:hypothetical protein AB0I77_46755 [Streptomyces sp. NPDC050619]|uniref:hypothetical protein n=1 Tax=Streptomyces sp. NPDC050619 TaxID=3157214 RepID=UPI003435B0CD
MLQKPRQRIALWVSLAFVFLAGAVSLLVVATQQEESGNADAPQSTTSWYTTQPPTASSPRGQGTDTGGSGGGSGGSGGGSGGSGGGTTDEPTEEPTGEPTGPTGESAASPPPDPVVTQTVIAIPGGGGGDGGVLIASIGSLLSGVAAVGTLAHAVHLSRQNRRATTGEDPAAAPASSP